MVVRAHLDVRVGARFIAAFSHTHAAESCVARAAAACQCQAALKVQKRCLATRAAESEDLFNDACADRPEVVAQLMSMVFALHEY